AGGNHNTPRGGPGRIGGGGPIADPHARLGQAAGEGVGGGPGTQQGLIRPPPPSPQQKGVGRPLPGKGYADGGVRHAFGDRRLGGNNNAKEGGSRAGNHAAVAAHRPEIGGRVVGRPAAQGRAIAQRRRTAARRADEDGQGRVADQAPRL